MYHPGGRLSTGPAYPRLRGANSCTHCRLPRANNSAKVTPEWARYPAVPDVQRGRGADWRLLMRAADAVGVGLGGAAQAAGSAAEIPGKVIDPHLDTSIL